MHHISYFWHIELLALRLIFEITAIKKSELRLN